MNPPPTSTGTGPASDECLDLVFRALASPYRRRMLDLLRGGPHSTSAVAAAFPGLSRFAVMQHLGVLEEAGLVITRKWGRTRVNHLNAVPIQQIYDRWVSQYAAHWTNALTSLKREMEKPPH